MKIVGFLWTIMLVVSLDSCRSDILATCGGTVTSTAEGFCIKDILLFKVGADAKSVSCKRNSGIITVSLKCQACFIECADITPCGPIPSMLPGLGLGVDLKNIQGTIVASGTISVGNSKIEFSGLPSGIYQIESTVLKFTDPSGNPINPLETVCTIDTLCVKVPKERNCNQIFCCLP